MNLQQLRYLVEIEKTHSISTAADNLYMGQPNLSRSIRELEESLGFDIFHRTAKGTTLTRAGKEVFLHAKEILTKIEAIEELGRKNASGTQVYGVSVPHAYWVSYAFAQFASSLDFEAPIALDFQETNALHAIENVQDQRHSLAVIRYARSDENAIVRLLQERELAFEQLSEVRKQVLFAASHPLAQKESISLSDLTPFLELVYGDETAFDGQNADAKPANREKQISIYNRAVLIDLLIGIPTSFAWTSLFPKNMLERNGLVLRPCAAAQSSLVERYVLIYRRNHELSALDKRYVNALFKCIAQCLQESVHDDAPPHQAPY